MRWIRRLLTVLLVIVVAPAVLVTLLLVTVRGSVIGFIVDRSADEPVTAAVLQVSDGRGTRVWHAGETVLPDTRFRIGSVTKTFVATVVLQMIDEKLLALDDPIEQILPGVVPRGESVTIRQLLNHTSGLYDYMKEPGMSTNRWRGEDRFRHFDVARLLSVAFAHPPYFAPGTRFRYSNTNYVVLGSVIEKVTGRPYADAIRTRILEPLGLRDTLFPGDDPTIPAPLLPARSKLASGVTVDVTEQNPALDWSAGEMISSTSDLAVFFDALMSGRLLSASMLAGMKQTVPMGLGFHYGLGVQRFDLPCGVRLWGHGGELLGYLTYVFVGPDERVMTMVLASAQGDNFAVFAAAAAAVFCLR
ncbi:class A beta-lactamase-related serine hydrolase [Nocardia panacis]|uniref:Class A beta-lactamase-related serine hydrolase n=1 Tax=Nocardia panacis TaxID=2340916 RepID=A0A3A4KQN7_9NOCA|nr:serine hydrolase domain-containing protein [Nocardia panacis]RJO78005.1 class A beta-lactamase-related serine hydrolase [Nocardia panacis]